MEDNAIEENKSKTRTCTECGVEKPLSEFGKSKYQAKDGHTFKCKSCISAYRRRHYAENDSVKQKSYERTKRRREKIPDHVRNLDRESERRRRKNNPDKYREKNRKWAENNKDKIKEYRKRYADKPKSPCGSVKFCTKCSSEKPIEEFRKNRSTKDGLQSWCKSCQNDYARDAYANKDIVREKSREKSKKWASDNPDKVKRSAIAASRKYTATHLGAIREYNRKYRDSHPGFTASFHNRRRARISGNGGSYTAQEFLDLCSKYNNRCLCCGRQVKLEADHILAISMGGKNDISNIQPLCRTCNSRKYTKFIDYRNPFVAMAT